MSLTLDAERDRELDFLRESARTFLEDRYPTARVREAREAEGRYLPATWEEVSRLGWPGLLVPIEHGGEGASLFEAAVLAEELGRALCETPFVSSSVVSAEILARSGAAAAAALLPGVASGKGIVTFSETGAQPRWDEVRVANGKATGRKAIVPYARTAAATIVAGMDPAAGERLLFLVRQGATGATTQALETIDAEPLFILDLEGVDVADTDIIARGGTAEALARRGLGLGAVMTAMAAVGGAARAVEITAEYTKTRVQFGRPIATFQAVKHRVADMYSSMALAQPLAYAAVRALSREAETAISVATASTAASQSFNAVARGMLQMHGGVGYTWEVDVHLFLRRAAQVAAMYGTETEHLETIAATLPERARKDRKEPASYTAGITLSPADIAFRDEWRAWLDANVPDDVHLESKMAEDASGDTSFVRDWRRRLAEGNWAAISWPKQFGGREATALQQLIFREELLARRLPENIVRITTGGTDAGNMAGACIVQYGTEKQQKEFLPRILRGEVVFCQGFSEPDAGSDLAGLKTRAVLDGDEFVVNGQKIWTSGAHLADWIYMLVRTNPDAPKHRGISMLLVDLNTPGIVRRRIKQIAGGSHFNEVFFEDVHVPRENLIGELDRGWVVTRSSLEHERSGLSGTQILESTLASLVRTAQRTTLPNGKLAFEDDGYRRQLAKYFVTIEALRQLGYSILMMQVKGIPLGPEPSIGKVTNSELRQSMTELSMEMLGPVGTLTGESPLAVNKGMAQFAYLVERGATIGGGTSEVNRNGIAEKGLGMPKD